MNKKDPGKPARTRFTRRAIDHDLFSLPGNTVVT
jgi:hypothetical protein